jgi:magnesium-transporting ATPase (P-type)
MRMCSGLVKLLSLEATKLAVARTTRWRLDSSGRSFAILSRLPLILTVAAIPVAFPAVLSVTMAAGASVLARMKAIVSRLAAIEEMAGMDILCADKTGMLSKNDLELGSPVVFKASDEQELVLASSWTSRREGGDGIDETVHKALSRSVGVKRPDQVDHFTPFDPVSKANRGRGQTRQRHF